jgi:hypothetical protein
MDLGENYLTNVVKEFRRLKRSAEKAISQASDADFFQMLDSEANSIAVIVKHVNGNLFSRWSDFLTSDGEKPERNRDTEFELTPGDTREALMQRWEQGWQILFAAIGPLRSEDLLRTVSIRGEAYTVVEAVNRQLTHYGEHVGQIVLLAKHFAGAKWQTLSIPRGKSVEFNAKLEKKLRERAGQ